MPRDRSSVKLEVPRSRSAIAEASVNSNGTACRRGPRRRRASPRSRREGRIGQVPGRQVDGHREVPAPRPPSAQLAERSGDHPGGDVADEAAGLGKREESTGPRRPRRGCSQRTSASAPTICPVVRDTFGWKHRRSSSEAMARCRLPEEPRLDQWRGVHRVVVEGNADPDPLRLVHGPVGPLHQLFGLEAVERGAADTDAGPQPVGPATQHEGLVDRLEHSAGRHRGPVGVPAGGEDCRELVAPQPGDHVRPAQGVRIRRATSTRISSPTAWPTVSFTSLKPSRSRTSTDSGRPVRRVFETQVRSVS